MTTTRTRDSFFDALIRDNENDLWRYFQRRILNPADAAEAFGELLVVAWRRRRRIPSDPHDARLWLFTAARNVMLNARRSAARYSSAVQRLMQDAEAAPTSPDDPRVDELREALRRLSPDDAELVRLTYWDGLTSPDAAVILDINPSTARSRLARIRQDLRVALEQTALAE